MALTNYNEYIRKLRVILDEKCRTETSAARVQITIFRNGFSYQSSEFCGNPSFEVLRRRPILSDCWEVDIDCQTKAEIEHFFALYEILAYSEVALKHERNPTRTPHWDATVALIEVAFFSGDSFWEQRMLFAGFADPIHADFSRTRDRDILVHDHLTGARFFEWRSTAAGNVDPSRTTSFEDDLGIQKRSSGTIGAEGIFAASFRPTAE
ncbi:hypothetical protein [Agrobacterium tumefaciens]|uniref:hypothetical protein n=1 Tax=Agrobacterium tumefaciens TaxID=358 RepID=UPI00287E2425|nr:hypothetical protein [Agrobacterium tumefaciens]MDS7598509.1 hypothetical protein [Agrobacterium tumefaciens]